MLRCASALCDSRSAADLREKTLLASLTFCCPTLEVAPESDQRVISERSRMSKKPQERSVDHKPDAANAKGIPSRFGAALITLLLLVVSGALNPGVAHGGRASGQLGVSVTVAPRCLEWNSETQRFAGNSQRRCLPDQVRMKQDENGVRVSCAPGNCPVVTHRESSLDGYRYVEFMY